MRKLLPLCFVALWSGTALAKPIAPTLFCTEYLAVPACFGGEPQCTLCHTTPPAHNTFGAAVARELAKDQPRPLSDAQFAAALPAALHAVEELDADGDGYTNFDEIIAGTWPADRDSAPAHGDCPPSSAGNGGYDVCRFDPAYVFEKINLDFCNKPVALAELDAFRASTDPTAELHAALDRCLDSPAWLGQDGALYRIAHKKIRPVQSIKSGEGAGDIPLGDYDDDYQLFVWTQIDNHDAREVLTAQYFVRRTGPASYESYEKTPFQDISSRGEDVAQLVEIPRRAGMITTRWNFVLNTMFTPIPRTNAAGIYRSFLGLDISKSEGLASVEGEPRDYDRKGVTAEECARCHATLDPLTYPFSRYSGFNGGVPFSYVPERIINLAEGPNDPLLGTPERGVIFGQEVADLLEWAQVAANSDAFAKATVLDYWRYLFDEPPRPTENEDFDRLWRSFKSQHQYGVEHMLHDLIMTEAYGVP